MTFFDLLTMIGGLSLFLFGMNIMGEALERRAGSKLSLLLGRLTNNKAAGFLTGVGVTAVIQSSSATTVMVVGFVNSGIMTLKQAINVIMGANVGTTVTAWILSLGGIDSGTSLILKLFKPTSFSPVLALIGIIFQMFCKSDKKKDTGAILLGFATLMFGMDTMSGAVSGLADVPAFTNLFIAFKNPILGVIAGAVLTAVIQSSSASVGILQALALSTGAISYGAAIPIIMGQNIGTCITAILSSFGTNRNAKRTAMVHLSFNVIGTVVWLTIYSIVNALFEIPLFDQSATSPGIAIAHSIFNIACTVLLLPASGLLEKLAYKLVPETKSPDTVTELDERLLATPSVALERCKILATQMAVCATTAMKDSLTALKEYTPELAEKIRKAEEKTDHYEDVLGSYLVKISTAKVSEEHSREAAMLLMAIGDFERISDHSVNILESAEEMRSKNMNFSASGEGEMATLCSAVYEAVDLSLEAFINGDISIATKVEPLEQVIDEIKETLRSRHIKRLQQGECSIEAGFVWSDLLTNLERTADHCSNIAGELIDNSMRTMNIHESLRSLRKENEEYQNMFDGYSSKYVV